MNKQSLNFNNHETRVRNKKIDEKFCESCGEIIKVKAEICPKCGVRQNGMLSNKIALLLVTLFLGGLGAHKFYTGRNWQGVIYLLFFWTGIPGIIALIEFFIYAFTSSEKLQEKYFRQGSGLVFITIIIGCIVFFAIAGILAAIAIPQFAAYKHRSYQVIVKSELQNLLHAEEAYFIEYNKYTKNLEDLNFNYSAPNITIEIISANDQCFEATGQHSQVKIPLLINCNGFKERG